LDEAGTLGSTVTMSGGKLDVDETMTLSGALTLGRATGREGVSITVVAES